MRGQPTEDCLDAAEGEEASSLSRASRFEASYRCRRRGDRAGRATRPIINRATSESTSAFDASTLASAAVFGNIAGAVGAGVGAGAAGLGVLAAALTVI